MDFLIVSFFYVFPLKALNNRDRSKQLFQNFENFNIRLGFGNFIVCVGNRFWFLCVFISCLWLRKSIIHPPPPPKKKDCKFNINKTITILCDGIKLLSQKK